jgi:hypothetical protein
MLFLLFKVGFAATSWHNDARPNAAVAFAIPGQGFVAGFAGRDFNDAWRDDLAALFKPGDATGKRAGHVTGLPPTLPRGRQGRLRECGR